MPVSLLSPGHPLYQQLTIQTSLQYFPMILSLSEHFCVSAPRVDPKRVYDKNYQMLKYQNHAWDGLEDTREHKGTQNSKCLVVLF